MRQLALTVTDQNPPQLAFERVQPIARQVEGLRSCSAIKAAKNVFDRIQQVMPDAAPVITLIEPFQAPVLEAPDHQRIV